MPRRKHGRKETDAAGDLAEVSAAWSRLNESQRTMFFAALIRELMTKPAMQSELMFWIATLQDRQAALVASVAADLAVMGTESDKPGPGRG
jgi:hypothetical protein